MVGMLRPRYLARAIAEDALPAGKMAFVSGPRQVGKTTLGKRLLADPERNYFSWDETDFRRAWATSPTRAVMERGEGPVLLDEIHKDRRWKSRLKGLYDTRGDELRIIVTGSARLDLYRRGGESLLGRYFPYRLHPFSVGESEKPPAPEEILATTDARYPWADLLKLGGFPEPLFGGSERRARRWSRLRLERLIAEDLRDLRAIADLQAVRVLADLLPGRVGSLLSMNALREDLGVAYGTVRAWLGVFEALYLCFLVRPYAARLARALRAEPKLYVYDVLSLPSAAARQENLVALHLLKACHYWTDTAQGEFDLRFVRDKEKREIDFLVLRDHRPWLAVECKSNQRVPSGNLVHFSDRLEVPLRFQLVNGVRFDRAYPETKVRVLDYERFLAGLP